MTRNGGFKPLLLGLLKDRERESNELAFELYFCGLTNKRYEYYFTYIKFNYKIRNLLYSTNYIERLNRDFKRTVRMRGSLPNVDSALLLLCSVAMNKQQTYSRVIPRLKYEEKLFSIEIDNCL